MSAGLGCAFSRAGADTKGEWQHERYLSSWLKRLKADNRYLFRAECAASGAHEEQLRVTPPRREGQHE